MSSLPPEPIAVGPPAEFPTPAVWVPPRSMPALPTVSVLDLYDALLSEARCHNTREARRYDAEVFRRWMGAPTPSAACAAFVSAGRGQANAIGLAFRAHETSRGQSPASVNRRQAMLRKVVALARRFDLVEWVVDLPDLPNHHTSDRRGPGDDGWRALWAAAVAGGGGPAARRDRAIIMLLHDSALRVSEVAGIDYPDDFDPARPAVRIFGKGATAKEWITVNSPTAGAIGEFLAARGAWPGPMFLASVQGRPGQLNSAGAPPAGPLPPRAAELLGEGLDALAVAKRLASEGYRRPDGMVWMETDVIPHPAAVGTRRVLTRSVNRTLTRLAKRAGLTMPVRPHGLRHAGITRALDLTNGDIRKVAKYARHANPKTTMLYDDDRSDFPGFIAGLLGDDD